MPIDESLLPVIPPLHDLVKWLESSGIPHVIVGGVAAALQGKPRAAGLEEPEIAERVESLLKHCGK